MEKISFDRNAHNLLDRLTENVGKLATEVERLNENLEEMNDESRGD